MTENLDERLKKSTIGLVTLSDFQKTKDDLEEQQRQLAAKTLAEKVCVKILVTPDYPLILSPADPLPR